ncbi:MAG: pantoate--beta-alanine ligase [Peptococcaceae bacterium]|nr:pantoate--beta-alanine ligase [Peptococcaceae bacterium]
MKITEYIDEVRGLTAQARAEGRRVALVPTMGYLHEGHLSLVRAARESVSGVGAARESISGVGAEADNRVFVVMSIFVNPLQFGPQEDFEKYPRDLARDQLMAASAGVDLLFVPSVEEMYPSGPSLTLIQVAEVSEGLCGAARPGHFTGVATVVAKLLLICQPDEAFFGQKDYQQLMVIRQMAMDLCIPTRIVSVPILREKDGLAMSSRNVYLSPEYRLQAPVLYEALCRGADAVLSGETDYDTICALVRDCIAGSAAQVEYVEIRDREDWKRPERLHQKVVILLAARLGETRLIDNILVGDRGERI